MRIRTHAAAYDDAVRLRLGSMLAGADVRPAGLMPSAILCIRRLVDPRPGRLPLGASAVRPPADWEDAARSAVADAAASAVRPSLGPVPAGAGAVLFLDRSELLACLARDWCDDLFHTSWWWRALLGSRDAAEAVLRAFRETPHAAPAALDMLARARCLEPFLRRLTPASARAIARDVARTFGLDEIATEVASGRVPRRGTETDEPCARDDGPPTPPVAATDERITPRIAAIAPEIVHMDLDDAPRALAILALVLHRAPATAARVLRQHVAPEQPPPRRVPRRLSRVGMAVEAREPNLPRTTHSEKASLEVPVPPAPAVAYECVPAAATPDGCFVPPTTADRPREAEPTAEDAHAPYLIDTSKVIETAFGGAFYLINVATSLGLYADFTAPRGHNLPLPLWDFLAIVADRLAGDGFSDDPLSALFGSLAGRGPDQPLDDRRSIVRGVRRLVPSMRRRIARGLGVHPNVAGPLLVMAPARVLVAAATIDVRFSLAGLPIEVRLAGLDRDPGFVPAAARTVMFAYV